MFGRKLSRRVAPEVRGRRARRAVPLVQAEVLAFGLVWMGAFAGAALLLVGVR